MLGAKVAVVEMLPHVLPTEDAEISQGIQQLLVKSGIGVHTSAEVKSVGRADGQLQVTFVQDKKTFRLKADKVLIAVGRRPFHAQLGVERIGLRLSDNRTIAVNERLETNVPGIFAVGDVIRGPMLAHKATAEGEAAAHFAVGLKREFPQQVIPSVIYTMPEAARAGLTEAQARSRFERLLIGRFPFAANGRAIIEGAAEGFVKVIAEGEYERIVGASILGPDAGHLIEEAALAIQMEASLEDVAETIHAHPTLTEAFREAVLDAKGQAIHLPPRSARRL
jgi:dihydrolipoamide dehydrogenase